MKQYGFIDPTYYVASNVFQKENHISSNFSFNTDIFWRFLIQGSQGCGRISWLLSEILFFRPLMNKKIRLIIENIGSYVVRRIYEPVLFHIHLPTYRVFIK